MRLVYLYGPPGVGKLTVARELIRLTGFKLLHNHLTVNLVCAVFPFGSPSFQRLLREFRDAMLAEAARMDVDLVLTGVYLGTEEQTGSIRRRIEPIYASNGSAVFVQLTCERATWLARVPNESRKIEGKLTDPARAIELFHGVDPFVTMPLEPTLRIDTTDLAPADAAMQIVQHYRLPLGGDGGAGRQVRGHWERAHRACERRTPRPKTHKSPKLRLSVDIERGRGVRDSRAPPAAPHHLVLLGLGHADVERQQQRLGRGRLGDGQRQDRGTSRGRTAPGGSPSRRAGWRCRARPGPP